MKGSPADADHRDGLHAERVAGRHVAADRPHRYHVALAERLPAALADEVGAPGGLVAPVSGLRPEGRLEPAAPQLGARPGDRAPLLAPSPDRCGVRVDHRYTAVPTRRVPDSSRSMAAPTVLERKAESANFTDTLPAL